MTALLMLMLAGEPVGEGQPDVLLLDFTAGYCQPCQQMVPLLQRMEDDGFPIRKVDITTNPKLSRQYNVEVIPTLVLLVEGREVKRFTGLTAESELRREMNAAARAMQATRAKDSKSGGEPMVAQDDAARQPHPATETPRRRSIGERLADLFGGGQTAAVEPTTIRGQDPGSTSVANDRLVQAYHATVRIRVSDAKHEDVGTGTVIHSTAGSSLVLTCAHLFSEFLPDAAIEVDVFEGESVKRYPATLVGGDHSSDLAIIRLQNAEPLPAVPLPAASTEVAVDQPLVSFGCNRGNDPTPLQTRVRRLNPYLGPHNLTCSTPPEVGRSGGGLFNEDGTMIGVCSAADKERTEGLYTGFNAVLDLLSHCQLSHVLEGSSTASAALDDEFRRLAQNPSDADVAESPVAAGGLERSVDASATTAALAELPRNAAGPEVTVVIDPKTPGGQKRIVVIPEASPWLVELLTGESPPNGNGPAVAVR